MTWRDVQYLLVWTSQVAPLSDNCGWNKNKAGFLFSVDFGFGLVNAYKLVKLAKEWKNVPEMSSCAIRMPKVKYVSHCRISSMAYYIQPYNHLKGSVQKPDNTIIWRKPFFFLDFGTGK